MDIKEIGSEFKAFIMKGNVVDLAVGVVIGQAFGKVVEALVGSIINPMLIVLRILPGGAALSVAAVFNSIITFIAIAAVVFFLIVKPMNILTARMKRQQEDSPAATAALPPDIALLTEIRDLLKTGKPVPPVVPPSL